MDLLISESEQLLGHAINLASPLQVANALYEVICTNGMNQRRKMMHAIGLKYHYIRMCCSGAEAASRNHKVERGVS